MESMSSYEFAAKGANLTVVLVPAETRKDKDGADIIVVPATRVTFERGKFETRDRDIASKLMRSSSGEMSELFLSLIDGKIPTDEQVKKLKTPGLIQTKTG